MVMPNHVHGIIVLDGNKPREIDDVDIVSYGLLNQVLFSSWLM